MLEDLTSEKKYARCIMEEANKIRGQFKTEEEEMSGYFSDTKKEAAKKIDESTKDILKGFTKNPIKSGIKLVILYFFAKWLLREELNND